MSKSGELRILRYGRSVDAPVNFRHRTGDNEDGVAFSDTLEDESASALDMLIESEGRDVRVKFLKQFFALLKQTLSPEEFKFIKLRFTKQKTDNQIVVWLGLKSAGFVFRSIREKLRAHERTIRHLAMRSKWNEAELFIKQIMTSINDLSRNECILDMRAEMPKDARGFHALKQAVEIAERRENMTEERKIRRRFYMRGMHQASKDIFKSEELEKINKEAQLNLCELIGTIDACRDLTKEWLDNGTEIYKYRDAPEQTVNLTPAFFDRVVTKLSKMVGQIVAVREFNIEDISRKAAFYIMNNDYSNMAYLGGRASKTLILEAETK